MLSTQCEHFLLSAEVMNCLNIGSGPRSQSRRAAQPTIVVTNFGGKFWWFWFWFRAAGWAASYWLFSRLGGLLLVVQPALLAGDWSKLVYVMAGTEIASQLPGEAGAATKPARGEQLCLICSNITFSTNYPIYNIKLSFYPPINYI